MPSMVLGRLLLVLQGSGNGGFILDITEDNRIEIANNNIVDSLFYLQDRGPIDISVIDPCLYQMQILFLK